MDKYYIAENGTQSGPFTLEELRAKSLHTNSLIWKERTSNWVEAKDIPEVNELFKSPLPINSVAKSQVGFPNSASRDSIVGTVRHFTSRTETKNLFHGSQNVTVWSFHLERYDENNNLLAPVPVEMRGVELKGSINEGETIQLVDKWKKGETIFPKSVYNQTTNTWIEGGFGLNIWQQDQISNEKARKTGIKKLIFFIFILLIIGVIVLSVSKKLMD